MVQASLDARQRALLAREGRVNRRSINQDGQINWLCSLGSLAS